MPVDTRIQAAIDAPHGAGTSFARSIKPKRGYAAAPGSGPAGQFCAGCRHVGGVRGNEYQSVCRVAKRSPYGGLMFISPTSHACSRWEARS